MKTVKAQERLDEVVTAAVLEQALERDKNRPEQGVHATIVQYLQQFQSLFIGFADHSAVALPVNSYAELAELSPAELSRLTLGYGGSALCLDERDLHVSIAGMILASKPLMAMAATVISARNGSRSSASKAIAARANGQKGGRPRKVVQG